jgi:hypothetical protein
MPLQVLDEKYMSRAEELRTKSIECLTLAQTASDPVVRKELMQLAARFRQLAIHVEDGEAEPVPVVPMRDAEKDECAPRPGAD